MVKRINALPGVTAEKKANLIEKMNKARSMERLTVIPFDIGQTTLHRAAADELVKAFDRPEMRDKLSDPTTILVVAGYADTGGRADLKSAHLTGASGECKSEFLKNRQSYSTLCRQSEWEGLNFSIASDQIRIELLRFGRLCPCR